MSTPRTDAFLLDHDCGKYPGASFGDDWSHYDIEAFVDHARQLEREVQALQRWKDAALTLTTEQSVQHVLEKQPSNP